MPEIGTAARTVLVIGIGAGDPEHLTLQAAAAIGRAEVFFEIDKGVPDLAGLRATLLARHARPDHRVVTAPGGAPRPRPRRLPGRGRRPGRPPAPTRTPP